MDICNNRFREASVDFKESLVLKSKGASGLRGWGTPRYLTCKRGTCVTILVYNKNKRWMKLVFCNFQSLPTFEYHHFRKTAAILFAIRRERIRLQRGIPCDPSTWGSCWLLDRWSWRKTSPWFPDRRLRDRLRSDIKDNNPFYFCPFQKR